MSSLTAIWDEASSDEQFAFSASLKDQGTSLILTVRDRRHLRKFSNSYNSTALSAKGLTQSLDKLQKMLSTAATTDKVNWSMRFGYHSTPNHKASAKLDLMPSYLSPSETERLRKKPKNGDTLYVVLSINEDFFSVSTQFKLFEIERVPKTRSRSKTNPKTRRALSTGISTRTLDSMQLFGPEGGDDAAEQKVAELMAEIKSLSRDNQVLKKKLQKMQSAKGKDMKKMDTERAMRLQANKERFWLKQKLDRLQKAIAARLKILASKKQKRSLSLVVNVHVVDWHLIEMKGVDFSKAEDITSALDIAFNVIQKLAKELQSKEEELEDAMLRMSKAEKQHNTMRKAKESLDAVIEKQRGATKDLKKQIRERDRRLSLVAHQKNDAEAVLTVQLQTLQSEMEQIHAEKERAFNQLVDEKAALTQQRDDALRQLEDMKDELHRVEQSIKALSLENEQIKEDNESLLTSKSDADAKLEEMTKEHGELRSDLDSKSKAHNILKNRNKTMQQQICRLNQDLSRLKALLQRASSLELQLKSVLDDSHQVVGDMELMEVFSDTDDMDSMETPAPGSASSSSSSSASSVCSDDD